MWNNLKKGIQNDLYNGVFKGRQASMPANIILGRKFNEGLTYGAGETKKQQYTYQPIERPKAIPLPKQITTTPQPKKNVSMPKLATKIISPLGKGGLNWKPPVKKVQAAEPMPTPVPDAFESRMMGTADAHQIPREVFFGIAGAENGKINKFNLGAVDSNPNNAVQYDSDLAAATSAAKFLSGQAEPTFYGNGMRGKQQFADAYAQRKDTKKYLEKIRDAGFAGDPKTWKARSIAQKGAGQYYDTWDEFVRNTPAYKKWSKK